MPLHAKITVGEKKKKQERKPQSREKGQASPPPPPDPPPPQGNRRQTKAFERPISVPSGSYSSLGKPPGARITGRKERKGS